MEPKFQTSFIPKTPITSNGLSSYQPGHSFSIVGTFSTVVFIISLLAAGGLFGYEMYVNAEIKKAQVALSEARAAFQSEDNQKIILASDQLKSISTLLNNHATVSPIFELLEKYTLPTIRLTSFSFSRDISGEVTVLLEGDAQSYASLAQQVKVFSEVEFLKNFQVTNVTLSDSGVVRAKMKVQVDTNLLLYTKKLQAVSMLDNSSL